MNPKRIIILAVGFGGVKCAKTLRDLQEWRSRESGFAS
jgi:hypothetical protein